MLSEINKADIVAEVRAVFDRYNAALNANDVEQLNDFFWRSPTTVRFGPGENLHGYEEISQFRSNKWTGGTPRRQISVTINTVGRNSAATSAIFEREGEQAFIRQSQFWARLPEGWRIVAAHVSLLKK